MANTTTLPAARAARRRTRRAPAAQPVSASWSARVMHCDGAELRLEVDGVTRMARRAASCLLAPEPGDQVICMQTGTEQAWVVAILVRAADTPALLACPTSLEIAAPELRLRSGSLDVYAEQAVLSVGVAEVIGRQLRATATTLKLVGSVLSSVMDRVTQFSRDYQRTTQGMDRVRATHIEREAQQLLRLQGEHVLTNGSKLVKARGAQIHFG